MDMPDIRVLAARVQEGDAVAVADWHRHVDPRMVRIVRRALGPRTPPSPLTLHIRAEAHRLRAARELCWDDDAEDLARLVAHRIGQTLLEQLRPLRQTAVETVCN
jgi:hypothetical protein